MNLRSLGISKGAEKDNTVGFISTKLRKWFLDLGAVLIKVMWAYRIPHSRNISRSGPNCPRTLICKFLRFADRDRILQVAKKLETPIKINKKIRFAIDYSPSTLSCKTKANPRVVSTSLQLPCCSWRSLRSATIGPCWWRWFCLILDWTDVQQLSHKLLYLYHD